MHGLMVRSPWIERILAGHKTWEIRGINTRIRGQIALIRSGSSQILGVCELVDVIGPLTLTEMFDNAVKHGESVESLMNGLPYEKTYAWVLRNARPFIEPIPYKHPSGAIIWVKLPDIKIEQSTATHESVWHHSRYTH